MKRQVRQRLPMLWLAPSALAVAQAWAQSPAAASSDTRPPAAAAPGSAASAPVAPRAQVQEVIVTAQKRTQPAAKTPLALSVLGGDDLKSAGAHSAAALTDLAPGVQIGMVNGAMNINIRGVTSNDATEKGDPSAAFNLDGVNLARPQAAGLAFFDLERVEILRGPQGTLYGRNSTAGAINVITMKPENRLGGSVALDLGNYKSRRADLMLNVPVSNALALRAALSSADHRGYISTSDLASGAAHPRGRDDQKDLSARLHALLKINRDTSLLLTADTSTMKGAGVGSIDVDAYLADRSRRRTAAVVPGWRDDQGQGLTAEFKTSVGFGELTYLGSQRTLDLANENSLGSSTAVGRSQARFKQASHELRLASAGTGPWQWVGGLFHFDERSRSRFRVDGALPFGDGSLLFDQDPVRSRSAAGFGQVTWAVVPSTRLTLGLRSTSDRKSRRGLNTVAGFLFDENDASVSYRQTNWKLGVDTDLRPNLMAYANAATGYKAGGFNDGTSSSNPDLTYAPEHLTAYEAGLKGRLLEGRLSLNLAAFWYDYQDLQVSSVSASTNQLMTQNAARARVHGVEAEGRMALSDNDRLSFSVSSLSATYRNYRPLADVDWSGRRLDKSPRGTLALAYTRQWPLASGAMVEAHIGLRWSDAYVLSDFTTATQYHQPSATKTDLRVSWTSADDKWTAQAYVRNLENETTISGYNFGTFSLGEPRTLGASIARRF